MAELRTSPDSLAVAVVTGGHPFNVPAFIGMWRDLEGIDAYVQPMEDWSDDVAGVRDEYDAVVFYNFHQATPTGDETPPMHKLKTSLERLGETKQGVVILHHAIAAYLEWPVWSNLVGVEERTPEWHLDQTLTVAGADHPITAGIEPFEIVDESYRIPSPEGSTPVLTTEHENSMPVVGWTHERGKARVFVLQLGHDNQAWANPSFRAVLGNGLRWAANSSQGSEFV